MEKMLHDVHWLNVGQWQACYSTDETTNHVAGWADVAHQAETLFEAYKVSGPGLHHDNIHVEKAENTEDSARLADCTVVSTMGADDIERIAMTKQDA